MRVKALRRTWVQSLTRVVEEGEEFEYDGKLSDNLRPVEQKQEQEPPPEPKSRRK